MYILRTFTKYHLKLTWTRQRIHAKLWKQPHEQNLGLQSSPLYFESPMPSLYFQVLHGLY